MRATLRLEVKDEKALSHIFKAEKELIKAGILFDTGMALCEGWPKQRDWELDWSLKGATLVNTS